MIELQEAETRALVGRLAKQVAEKYRLSICSMMCAGGRDETGAQWEGNDTSSGFYETKTAYYVCSDSRHVVGRVYNGLRTVVRIDKELGQKTVLNELYSKYESLEAITDWQ